MRRAIDGRVYEAHFGRMMKVVWAEYRRTARKVSLVPALLVRASTRRSTAL
jgi:hypothetical protein